MNLLAVDTTGEALSLALRVGEKTHVFSRRFVAPHDETLLPQIDRLLKRARIGMEDLDAVAAASGPGRFTGIRIGMAYAAVAGAQLGIPALAVSRLEAAAFTAPPGLVCAAVPGWRGEMYCQLFRRSAWIRGLERPAWVDAGGWSDIRGKRAAKARIVEMEPSAADLLAVALGYFKRRRYPPFKPLYLKPAGYERGRLQANLVR